MFFCATYGPITPSRLFPRFMNKKILLYSSLSALLFAFSSTTFAQTTARLVSYVDVAGAWNTATWSANAQYHQYLKIDRKGLFQVGWGIRGTHFRGNNLPFITALASQSRGKTGFSALSAPLLLRNIDTLQVSAGITSFNFNLGIQLSVFDKVDIGVNADILGLALGGKKSGFYSSTTGYNKVDSLNLHQTYQQAKPTSPNVQLLGDNAVGNLTTEIYARLHITERLGLKAGYVFNTNEYRTSNKQLVADVRRFRYRSDMFLVGVTFKVLR